MNANSSIDWMPVGHFNGVGTEYEVAISDARQGYAIRLSCSSGPGGSVLYERSYTDFESYVKGQAEVMADAVRMALDEVRKEAGL